MKLEIVVTRPPEAVVATLIGSINAANAPDAAAVLLPLLDAGGTVVLDAGQLEYISSAGLRLLLQLQRTGAATGARLILAALTPEVREVMHVTGFLRNFIEAGTLAEALKI